MVFGGSTGRSLDRNFYSLEAQGLKRLDLSYPGSGFAQNIMFHVDSALYLGGGVDSMINRSSNTEFWKYDLRQRSWQRLGDLPFSYLGPPEVQQLSDGSTYLIISAYTGTDLPVSTRIYRYSLEDDLWSLESECPDKLLFHAKTFVISDQLYLFFEANRYANQFSGDLMKYDFLTREWKRLEKFPFAPRMATFAFADGQSGFVGGGSFSTPFNDVYTYDPAKNHWSLITTLDRSIFFGNAWTVGNSQFIGFGIQAAPESPRQLFIWQCRKKPRSVNERN
jgi:N-acetylneuraminic acid mutarotase